jgi:hypothetical protein
MQVFSESLLHVTGVKLYTSMTLKQDGGFKLRPFYTLGIIRGQFSNIRTFIGYRPIYICLYMGTYRLNTDTILLK